MKFNFKYHDEIFQIDFTRDVNKPYKVLLSRIKDNEIKILAQDNDVDGEIDTLFTQNFTLDSLTQIYQHGVLMNSNFKITKNHVYTDVFEFKSTDHRYGLQTIIPVNGKISNRFVIQSLKENKKTIALDINADGILDEVYNHDSVSNEIQQQYHQFLLEGIECDAIVKNYNMVFIKTCMNERKK